MSTPSMFFITAFNMSAALSTSMRFTPGGVAMDTGPHTTVTSAPASRAAAATAKPIFPELRLLMKRTGSMRSRVGPAVSNTRLPASGPLGAYLFRHGLVPRDRLAQFVSLQGVKMLRPSRIYVSIEGQGDDITRVRVGGRSVLVGEGQLHL